MAGRLTRLPKPIHNSEINRSEVIMNGRGLLIAWLILLASLALGGIGWLVAESGTFAVTWNRNAIDQHNDLSPPDDSAAGTGDD